MRQQHGYAHISAKLQKKKRKLGSYLPQHNTKSVSAQITKLERVLDVLEVANVDSLSVQHFLCLCELVCARMVRCDALHGDRPLVLGPSVA